MKNQRKKTEARNFRFSAVAAILLMLATLICCFTVIASADTARLEVGIDDLTVGTNLTANTAGNGYYKTYDGNTTADIGVDSAKVGIDEEDLPYVELVVTSAVFDSKDVESASKITVSFEVRLTEAGTQAGKTELLDKYTAPRALILEASIKPATLSWAADATANVTYAPGTTVYNVDITAPALSGMVNGESAPAVTSVPKATVSGVNGKGTYTTSVDVVLDSKNYVAAPLTVSVTVDPVTITKIEWNLPKTAFEWGDATLDEISVVGFDAQDNPYALDITYPEGFGNVGTHRLTAVEPNDNYTILNTVSPDTSITVNKKVFNVSFTDVAYIGNAGIQADPTEFMLTVEGDIPANIRALITYTVNGAAFSGTSEYGSYTVTAQLPSNANYEFKDVTGNTLTATMTILRQYIAAGTADAPYQLILIGENGFAGDITANVTIPVINRRALRGFRQHTEYTLNVTGADGETFTVLIPISDTLYGKRLSALTADDLYIYEEANSSMTAATGKNYTVSVKDGYYQIEGVSGSAAITFVLAPEYNAPFWATAPGIALLILLIIALVALLLLIGLYLKRVRLSEENETMVIDTEGDVPEVVPAVIEDKVDADEALEGNADRLADELANEIEAEHAEENTEGVEEAVSDSMDELMEEVSAIELEKEVEETVEETVDETDVAAEMADEMAERLQETVETEDVEAEADEDALRTAVADALAENFNESADATEAIAIIPAVEEEESDEITPEDFRAVVDAIVSEAMCNTMEIPEAVEETAEEETVAEEETAETVEETIAEETAEEVTEEVTEEVAEETAEEVVEEATEEVAEETVEVAEEETCEEATEETTEEIVVEEMSNDDICAVVADSVAEAFELVSVDGVAPKAVEGTTVETITEAVNNAGDANIPETWTAEMADAVKEAVVDELAARLIVEETPVVEEEPAVEAFAEVTEEVAVSDEDSDDDNDAEEDEEDYGAFGSMPLDFIDAVAEADKYAAMLEDERNGYVRIVTRYKRSFQSRLAQSQGNVQEYYNIIKNALLSYKGVKNRISWNYEAFNRGRTHVAKLNAKTKTLYLYLALDPAELVDTKYGIVDMSSKKKYASVPVLMKIKGERKFKYALELIDKLCGENLTLPKLETEEVDYRIPYQTTEELVQAGIVKKMVASVPVVYSEADTAETSAPEETVASATAEAQEVTFIAPTDAPAVEAAAEEVAAEEAVAGEPATEAPVEEAPAEEVPTEEASAEEIPANAETSEEENKEI